MLKSLLTFFNTYQTRILLIAVCFALVTNIATIVVLFEQLEHESLCDQQNEFNEFVEDNHSEFMQQPSDTASNIIKIPKPKKLNNPPSISIPEHTNDKTQKNTSTSRLDWTGGEYQLHDFRPSEIKVTDWKYHLDINQPQLLSSSKECNYKNYASTIFMNALSKWIYMREYGYSPSYDCPKYLQSEYRPKDLIPHIYQSQCAPFWPSDIVYLLSELLTPSMIGIQYGFSLSTVWLSNFVSSMNVVDNRKQKVKEWNQHLSQNYFDLSNFELEYQRMSKTYVQRSDPKKGKIVDFVVMESVPAYHEDVLKYIVSVMRDDNAILVMKLSDENMPENINELIDALIPKHWLRYDSFVPDFLVKSVPFSQEQYLDQHNMTMWISRSETNPCKD